MGEGGWTWRGCVDAGPERTYVSEWMVEAARLPSGCCPGSGKLGGVPGPALFGGLQSGLPSKIGAQKMEGLLSQSARSSGGSLNSPDGLARTGTGYPDQVPGEDGIGVGEGEEAGLNHTAVGGGAEVAHAAARSAASLQTHGDGRTQWRWWWGSWQRTRQEHKRLACVIGLLHARLPCLPVGDTDNDLRARPTSLLM